MMIMKTVMVDSPAEEARMFRKFIRESAKAMARRLERRARMYRRAKCGECGSCGECVGAA